MFQANMYFSDLTLRECSPVPRRTPVLLGACGHVVASLKNDMYLDQYEILVSKIAAGQHYVRSE